MELRNVSLGANDEKTLITSINVGETILSYISWHPKTHNSLLLSRQRLGVHFRTAAAVDFGRIALQFFVVEALLLSYESLFALSPPRPIPATYAIFLYPTSQKRV